MPTRRRFLEVSAVAAIAPFVAACQNALGPSSIDSEWTLDQRGRFTFYTRPSSFASRSVEQLFAVLDDQYNATASMLDVRYAGHVSIFLYNSGSDAGLPSDHSGVAYPDTQAVRAVCVPPLDANLMVLLSHEFNHVMTLNTLGQAGTSFMTEGIATAVITERFHSQGRHFLYPWTAGRVGRLPAIATLLQDDHWHSDDDVAYNVSASFLAWLLDVNGPAPLKQVFNARSNAMNDRMQSAYGKPITQLESDWMAFCAAWRG
jgi:hypothetical protein